MITIQHAHGATVPDVQNAKGSNMQTIDKLFWGAIIGLASVSFVEFAYTIFG